MSGLAGNAINLYTDIMANDLLDTGAIPFSLSAELQKEIAALDKNPISAALAKVFANIQKNSVTLSVGCVPVGYVPAGAPASKMQDWYLLSVDLSIASRPGVTENSDSNRGAYLQDVVLQMMPSPAIMNAPGNAGLVLYPQTQPPTYEGTESVSSSVGGNLGGSVGFFGAAPTGSVSGGLSFSKSVSYGIPDVAIQNQCDSPIPQWELKLNPPYGGSTATVFAKLGPMSDASSNTLQFSALWVWHMPTASRPASLSGFTFDVSVTCTYGGVYVDGTGAHFNKTTCQTLVQQATAPWPVAPGGS